MPSKTIFLVFTLLFLSCQSNSNRDAFENNGRNSTDCYKLVKLLDIDSDGYRQLSYYLTCLKDSTDKIAKDTRFLDSLVFTVVDTIEIESHLSVEIYFDNKEVHEFIPGRGISDGNNLFEKPRFAFYGFDRTRITVRNVGSVDSYNIPLPENLVKNE
jgi:hypothetical protein